MAARALTSCSFLARRDASTKVTPRRSGRSTAIYVERCCLRVLTYLEQLLKVRGVCSLQRPHQSAPKCTSRRHGLILLGRPTALALPAHPPAQLPTQLPARTPAHVAWCVWTNVRTFSPQVRACARGTEGRENSVTGRRQYAGGLGGSYIGPDRRLLRRPLAMASRKRTAYYFLGRAHHNVKGMKAASSDPHLST